MQIYFDKNIDFLYMMSLVEASLEMLKFEK